MSAPTLAVWLETHPFADPTIATVPPDVSAAYHMNEGENVLADITITDNSDDPIPAENVENVLLELRRGEAPVGSWSWIKDGAQSDQIDVADGHIYLEILKEDTETLAGLYDFYVRLSVTDTDFFDSGAQTDVREFRAVLFVRAGIVNPIPT